MGTSKNPIGVFRGSLYLVQRKSIGQELCALARALLQDVNMILDFMVYYLPRACRAISRYRRALALFGSIRSAASKSAIARS